MTDETMRCWKHSDMGDERLALPIEQGVLMWCIRMQVIGMKRRINVQACIDGMLDALGAPAASNGLEEFVVALSEGCTRMIGVRCVCLRQIDPDERALLDVLSLAQAMRSFKALLILRGFVSQAGAMAALRGAERVGTALAQAGQFLPEPRQERRHFAMTQGAPMLLGRRETLH